MSDSSKLKSTCSIDDAANCIWDAVVIGAGPSGSIAARQLSLSGASVLLVDKAAFPRRKVCGCYLNQSGLGSLAAIGLGDLAERLGSPTVKAIRIGIRQRTATLQLPHGAAISRDVLDTALAIAAIDAGTAFLSSVSARVGKVTGRGREFVLRSSDHSMTGISKAIIVADGIGGQSLKDCGDIKFKVASSSLIGMSAVTQVLPENYEPGTIHMALGRAGYVGALQLQDGLLDVAAAFNPVALKRLGPGELAQQTSDGSGLPVLQGLDRLRWLGTPPLSRAPTAPAAQRLFLVGDAAGYVEPFTGEGMSWAMASGRAVVPFVVDAINAKSSNSDVQWTREYRCLLRSRQRACHWLTRALRSPTMVLAGVTVLERMPSLASPVINWINRMPEILDS